MKIKLNRIKSAIGMAVLSLLLPLAALYPTYSAQASPIVPQGYEEAARSEHLILFYNRNTGAIAVEDKRTGYVWKSVVDEDVYDLDQTSEVLKTYLTSIMVVTYVDISSNKESNLNKIYSSDKTNDIQVVKKTNGVTVNIEFKEVGISAALEVALDHDSLQIRIPAEQIKQTQNMGIVSLELMPFFGAAGERVDGYMFYPDGSGALTRYDRKQQRKQNNNAMKLQIYSKEQVKVNDPASMYNADIYDAMLPVFGVKNGNNAVLFAGTEGEEDAWINVNPDGNTVNLNRIGFEFNYRHFYEVGLSKVTIPGVAGSDQAKSTRADKEMIRSDREVKLFFLAGDEADYSGMANAYRDYLIGQARLNKSIRDHDSIPLGLDFFMGIVEERMFWNKFVSMTTFKDAQNMLGEVKRAGVDNLEVMLKGWTKGGYGKNSKNNWTPDSRLGGTKGLQALSDYMNENRMKLYLTNNLMQASKNGGFSTRKEVAKSGGNDPISDRLKSMFLLNPFVAANRLNPFLSHLNGYGGSGVAFGGLGNMIYHDYNKNSPAGRSNTMKIWDEMMEASYSEQKRIAVEGGNQYALKYASRLYNIPLTSSQNRITDETVPFYQMVVHGMIPYSSEPGNLSYDMNIQKLKWVEYGAMPYFELTYKKSVNLKNTAYNSLFTSYFKDWAEQAALISEEFNERLQSVWDQKMIRHQKVADNVYKVEYENGSAVYINYNEKAFHVDGNTVNALDYLVVLSGGGTQ